jgi:hypothetical protein
VGLPILVAQQASSPNLLPRVITAISDGFFLAAYLAASFVVLAAALLRRLAPRGIAALALVVAGVDVASAYHAFNPTTQDPVAGYRHPALVARLRADPDLFRVDSDTGVAGAWQPDAANVLGLQDAGGLVNPLQLASYDELRGAIGRAYGARAYDLFGVRYLIAPDTDQFRRDLQAAAPAGTFALVDRFDDGLAIYRNGDELPRARVVYRAERVSGIDDALARLRSPDFDPRQVALVEGPALGDSSDGGGGEADPVAARILTYEPNRVRLAAAPVAPAYLVLADAAYPGWRATVDGQPAPVYTAYGAFRAVPLAPGQHVVTFEFAPLSWEIGWRVSLAAWSALLTLLGRASVGPLRRRLATCAGTAPEPAGRAPTSTPAGAGFAVSPGPTAASLNGAPDSGATDASARAGERAPRVRRD